MSQASKIALVAGGVLAAFALAAGATVVALNPPAYAAAEQPDPTPTTAQTVGQKPDGYAWFNDGTLGIPADADGNGACRSNAVIELTSPNNENPGQEVYAELHGELKDTGPREFATGTTTVDDEGRPTSYTVAAGDVLASINTRFCATGIGAIEWRQGWTIQPGEVLNLRPNPDEPFVRQYL
ncbi:hypothetical protein K8F61_17195 [Microbacterium resistens]|uniref:LysM domain-containing protein n=1 Tax=Microbacterium resistens TaxID=156977 RepID=A0ABY3RTV5_9MICO|nr:hypothetical protein [Microbacterium resistens]UGS26340.1 hypothetical protein K8F61_17195 [Microbacterium resistens]